MGQVTEDEFLVEKILDKKHEDGVWKYFIKWIDWPSDTNTWEPLIHLKGCEQMLTAFEKKWALENPELAGAIKPDDYIEQPDESDYDSDEDLIDGRTKAEQFMDYEVMEECPPNKEPTGLVGVLELRGNLTYLVEWKKDQENLIEEDTVEVDRSLIRSTAFQLKYPSIVISYYEKYITFSKNPTGTEVVSILAAQAMTETRDREQDQAGVDEDNLDTDNSDPDAVAPTESVLNLNDLDSSNDTTESCDDLYEVDVDGVGIF